MKGFLTSVCLFLSSLLIAQTLTVTSPSGGDTLIGGQTYELTWTTTGGSISLVDIYYKRNGVLYLIEDDVTNIGSYMWTVPGNIASSSLGYIRVVQSNFTPNYDENDAPFRFQEAPKTLTVTYPNELDDTLQAGVSSMITWTSTGIISQVNIWYSLNDGESYSLLKFANSNSGSYSWTPPNDLESNKFRIKVVNRHSPYNEDASDTGGVLLPGLNITSPSSGTNLVIGNSYDIIWTTGGSAVTDVDLTYSKDYGAWTSITDSTPNNGTYSWVVPNDPSNNVRLRIRDKDNASNESQMSQGFSISSTPQTIEITSPNGGEIITEGTQYDFTWNASSSLDGTHVLFDYSIDSGQNWINFGDQFTDSGHYAWSVPLHVASTKCLIKINVIGLSAIADTTDATYTIALGPPSIKVLSPNGGQTYVAGAFGSINYQTTGMLDTLDMYYSIDSGENWVLHQTGIDPLNSSHSVNWPDVHSTNCLIKLQESDAPSVKDSSDAVFTIKQLKLNQPYSYTTFYQGTMGTITWSKSPSTADSVTLYYSLNSGENWSLISNAVPNTGSYSWAVPNDSSTTARIKIVDNDNSNVEDVSGADFSILPSPLQLTVPNGGEYWEKAAFNLITWNTQGSISKVRLYYSLDNGDNWLPINTNLTNTDSYNWFTPNISSSSVKVKVQNYYDANAYDVSDTTFNIGIDPPSSITVTSPNGGETLTSGGMHTITWTTTGLVDTVDLFYSLDNGDNWTTIATNEVNDSAYTWSVPSTNSTMCLVKIVASDSVAVKDSSDAVFTIGKSITVTSPNGGESLTPSTTYEVTWTTTGSISNVDLYYSTNGGFSYNFITSGEANDGSYNWTVPVVSSTECLFKIQENGNPSLFDVSNDTFSIGVVSGLTLTAPNGGEMLMETDTFDITWDTTGITSTIDLYYSTNGGGLWKVIDSNLANTGIFPWEIPTNSFSENCLVRIEAEKTSIGLSDESDAVFTIDAVHSINVTNPDYPVQFWTEGEARDIKWTTTGIISMVNIYVSNNDGMNYTLIDDSVMNNITGTNTYAWIVPHGLNSYDCKIKVEEVGNASVHEAEDVRISDIRTITITYPNGGESFNGHDTIDITWTETGLIHTIQMAYSLDSGENWENFHVVQLYDTGYSIEWVVPNISTTKALIRATEYQSGSYSDESDAPFTINAIPRTITVTKPNGGVWGIYGSLGIDWLSTGVEKVNIYYSIDSGANWYIINSNQPSDGHHTWNGPGVNTTKALIKIEDADSVQVYDISDTAFTIEGYSELEVLSPNGGELYHTDSVYTISWKHTPGYINPMLLADVYYSIDTGNTWSLIEEDLSVTTDSTYDWTVPSGISSEYCLIKVEDHHEEHNYDLSDNFFTIDAVKEIEITSPNHNELVFSDSVHTIRWENSGNIAQIDLFYSLDTGNTWIPIDSQINNVDSFVWNTPSGIHADCYIKIEETDNDSVSDISDQFVITTKVTTLNIVQPNGGEMLNGGQQYEIVWDWTGSFDDQWVLYYSIDSGANWMFITDGQEFESAQASVVWDVPNTTDTLPNCLVRIISFPYGDTSDATFTINGSENIVVNEPSLGEVWEAGNTENILWTTIGTIDTVNIHYSLNGGQTWINIASNIVNIDSFEWLIPNESSVNCKIRIESSLDTAINGESSIFTITNDTVVNPGIFSENQPNQVSIYPNPSTGILFIQCNSVVGSITIYNTLGSEVFTSAGISVNQKINVSTLDKGLYFVKVEMEGQSIIKRLVIR